MAQQTAVEWLEKQFDKYTSGGVNVPNNKIFKLTEKAKAMEKEQIMDAFYDGKLLYDISNKFDAEQYYNDKYENNK
jgi:hypothetical protein